MSTFLVGKTTAQWSEQCGLKTQYFAETDSTNTQAKAAGFASEISLFIAEHQTAGRGRGTNTWQSKAGDALLMSWAFPLPQMPAPVATPILGMALYTAAKSTWGFLPWALKAPNDLYLADKKIAGLLVEVLSQGSQVTILVGMGFNVFAAPELSTATHLREALGPALLESGLSRKTWTLFLDRLLLELTTSLAYLPAELNLLQRSNLLHALNKFPLLSEPYLDVMPDGSLRKASYTTAWQSL
jgi:BirA family biotin operon repressor/biotin-[acetyl-CoA-carboxylase] ligase